MKSPASIPQYFLKSLLQYAGLGLFLLCFLSLGISFLLTRHQVATDLRETALATVEAFRDRIVDGDIRSVEPQVRQLLKISSGESAQILKSDLSRVYDSFGSNELVKQCPVVGQTCFDGYFGQARILVPVSMSQVNGNPNHYLYISKRLRFNWGYLSTVFLIFTLGYLGLLWAFWRISKLTSVRLAGEITSWSDRLKANSFRSGS
jgi:hypothetical protein